MAACNGLILVLFPPTKKDKWSFIPKNEKISDEFVKLETWETRSGNDYSLYRVCYTKQKAHEHIERIGQGGEIFQGINVYIIVLGKLVD